MQLNTLFFNLFWYGHQLNLAPSYPWCSAAPTQLRLVDQINFAVWAEGMKCGPPADGPSLKDCCPHQDLQVSTTRAQLTWRRSVVELVQARHRAPHDEIGLIEQESAAA